MRSRPIPELSGKREKPQFSNARGDLILSLAKLLPIGLTTQEPRSIARKNQEPRTKNQEPRTKNQEPTKPSGNKIHKLGTLCRKQRFFRSCRRHGVDTKSGMVPQSRMVSGIARCLPHFRLLDNNAFHLG